MKQSYRLSLAFFVMLVAAFHVQAYDFSAVAPTGQTLYYTISLSENNACSVTSPGSNGWGNFAKPSGELVVPDTVEYEGTAYFVYRINTNAFKGCTEITSVTLPAGMKNIGNTAFSGCTQLHDITLPDSLSGFNTNVITGCTNLKKIVFGENFSGFTDNNYYFNDLFFDTLVFKSPLCANQAINWRDAVTYNHNITQYVLVPCGMAQQFADLGFTRMGILTTECCTIEVPVALTDNHMFVARTGRGKNDTSYAVRTILCEPGEEVSIYAFNKRGTDNYNPNIYYYYYDSIVDYWSNGMGGNSITFIAQNPDSIIGHVTSRPKAWLNINNISTPIDFVGSLGFDDYSAKFNFLSDTTATIYSTGLWVGGKNADTLHLAAHRFSTNGSDYTFGPYTTEPLTLDTAFRNWAHVWKIDRQQIDNHLSRIGQAGYQVDYELLTWPGPYVDVDDNGIYEPFVGDYPLIRGDQALFCIFNDKTHHAESLGKPLGIEVHMMAYAFNEPEGGSTTNPLNNTVFVNYKIYNMSPNSYRDCYLGAFTDFDLGYAWDDYVGCDVTRNMSYCYNGDDVDGPGTGCFQGIPPAQGCVILGGAEDGQDGRQKMGHFLYYDNSSSQINGEPEKCSDYYSYMSGYWKNGQHVLYGGNGISSGTTDLECNYMFPGDSDPQHIGTNGIVPSEHPNDWTEHTAGNAPGDRRGIASSGPFTFQAGSSLQFDLAYVAAKATQGNAWTSVELLREYVDDVQRQFERDTTDSGKPFTYIPRAGATVSVEETPASPFMQLYPNPTTGLLHLNLNTNGNYTAQLYDMMGHQLGSYQVRDGYAAIDLSRLSSGVYIVCCQGVVRRIIKR